MATEQKKKTAPRKGSATTPKYAKEGPAISKADIYKMTGFDLAKKNESEIREIYRSAARLANRTFVRLERSGLAPYSQFYQNWVRTDPGDKPRPTHWSIKGKTRNEMIHDIKEMQRVLNPNLTTATEKGARKNKKQIEELVGHRTPEDMKKFWEGYRQMARQEEAQNAHSGSPVLLAAYLAIENVDINRIIEDHYEKVHAGPYSFFVLKEDHSIVVQQKDVEMDAKRRLMWGRIDKLADEFEEGERKKKENLKKLYSGNWASASYEEVSADFDDYDELEPYKTEQSAQTEKKKRDRKMRR